MDNVLILMTFNRPEHTAKVIEGIRQEEFKKIKIYIDKAETKQDKLKQYELYEIFKKIDWADIELIQRSESLGLAKSVVNAVTETLQEYESVILLEDDCVPQKGFKNFMLSALELYNRNKKIRSISGYTYPCFNPGQISHDAFFAQRFCPWGWATWKDRWQDFDFNLKKLVQKSIKMDKPLYKIGNDIHTYCQNDEFFDHKMDIWSLNWILAHYLTSTLTLYPKYSLINNIGFDGTGIHSDSTNVFECEINPQFDKSKYNLPDNEDIRLIPDVQDRIIEFLEQVSKMTMIKNKFAATDITTGQEYESIKT
ncbi:MAG: hypothetical protein PHC34_07590 [Candidatus Gastranaerophilales bacterium]|nr:hypothetical protein [Candidatus Gastranaerophilales bacterium]